MHITIAGKLGSGKSTICKLLQERHGFSIYSTGAVQREVAKEMGITTLELNLRLQSDPKLDFIIDDAVTKLSRERKDEAIIFDSRMAWHFAHESFKIFVTIDPLIAAQRVMQDARGNVESYRDVEDARDKLIQRSMVENARFLDIYHVDNLDFHNYNFLIDTSFAATELICDVIYEAYQTYAAAPYPHTEVMFSPKLLKPTLPLGAADPAEAVEIAFHGTQPYVLRGHNCLRAALAEGADYLPGTLVWEDVVPLAPRELQKYEESYGFEYLNA